MPALYLDSSGWVAAIVASERGHATARQAYAAAASSGHRLVTTYLVVAEVHSWLIRWRDLRTGRRFLDTALDSGAHTFVPLDAEIMADAATRWVRRYADQEFSLCDAVSFEVMRRERITQALTFDHHFAVAGFETLR